MPTKRDIALARHLFAKKMLSKQDILEGLEEVDRVAKVGLEKFLTTVLVENGKLRPRDAEKAEAEMPAGHDAEAGTFGAVPAEAEGEVDLDEELASAGDAGQDDRALLAGVYACSKCGTVMDEDDVRSGKAKHIAGRLYCGNCISSDLTGGQIAAGYRIGARLRSTPISHIYRCKHLASGRTCAVEVIPEESFTDRIPINRIVQLGQAAAEFQHDNLLRFYEVTQWQQALYIAREHIDHQPIPVFLDQRRRDNKEPYSPGMVLKVVGQLADALAYAFDRGLVHGAITPSVVYMSKEADVKLADLGLPSLAPPDGECPYSAPELRGSPGDIDCRVDIYSAGMIAYELLTLSPAPLDRQGPPEFPDTVPQYVARLVQKMIATSPRERYSMPRNLLRAVDECKQKLAASATKIEQTDAEIEALRGEMAASQRRKAGAEAQLQALSAKRDAAVDKLRREMPEIKDGMSWGERRQTKKRRRETERSVGVVEKGFRRQTRELARAAQTEEDALRSIERKIARKIEQRKQVDKTG